jgi:ADP-ribose pyrophosphatase YjhB (NUDIX family)
MMLQCRAGHQSGFTVYSVHPALLPLQSVPVMGAIMLNPALDKCLLVKSWGSNGAWGFPRGKISKDEADADCARREVRTLVRTSVDSAESLASGPAARSPGRGRR